MKEFLLGSWGPQLAVSIKQYPLQVTIAVLTAITLATTLIWGVRGSDGSDSGGIACGDSDGGDGGCGGD